jgi:hypothetical protein
MVTIKVKPTPPPFEKELTALMKIAAKKVCDMRENLFITEATKHD